VSQADFKVAVVASESDADFAALITNASELGGGGEAAAAPYAPMTIKAVYGPTNATWDARTTGSVGNEPTYLQSDGAAGDHLEYKIRHAACDDAYIGLSFHMGNNRGIYTIRKGPTLASLATVGTIDGYAASGTTGSRGVIGPVSFTGEDEILQIIMSTKNASSSSFFGLLEAVYIYRAP
jgi:hypothetical protein